MPSTRCHLGATLGMLGLAMSACHSPSQYTPKGERYAQVHAIGHESVITFVPGRPVTIPIQAVKAKNQTLQIAVQVFGTDPPAITEYSFDKDGRSNETISEYARQAAQLRGQITDLTNRISEAESRGKRAANRLEQARGATSDAIQSKDTQVAQTKSRLDTLDAQRTAARSILMTNESTEQALFQAADDVAKKAKAAHETLQTLTSASPSDEAAVKAQRTEAKRLDDECGNANATAVTAHAATLAATKELKTIEGNYETARQLLDAESQQLASLRQAALDDAGVAELEKDLKAATNQAKSLEDQRGGAKTELGRIEKILTAEADLVAARKAVEQPADAGKQEIAQPTRMQLFSGVEYPGESLPPLAVSLSPQYTQRIKDGDHLRVQVTYGDPEASPNAGSLGSDERETNAAGRAIDRGQRVASRTFTLYTADTYRAQKIHNTIPPYEVRAFPLPDDEAEYLFGKVIEENYFVVRVAIRNSSTADDWLVNTGTLVVSGQALVEPTDGSPRFNLPVQVTPQSREHVYAVLDDEEVDTPRAVTFRVVEFAGTLATAFTTGFQGSEESIRALGLATGVLIPEAKKLWPDRWQGYKRNLVNYAMPTLIKIPKRSTSAAYLLFFSKKDLQTVILESALFSKIQSPASGSAVGFKGPPAHVVYLTFDGMEVPFEIVTTPDQVTSASSEARITDAIEKTKLAGAIGATSDDIKTIDSKVRTALAANQDPAKAKSLQQASAKLADLVLRARQAWLDAQRASSLADATRFKDIADGLLKDAKEIATQAGVN